MFLQPEPMLLSPGEVSAIVIAVLSLFVLMATVGYFMLFRRCVVILLTFIIT